MNKILGKIKKLEKNPKINIELIYKFIKYYFIINICLIYIIQYKYRFKLIKLKNYIYHHSKLKIQKIIKNKNLLKSYILYINICTNYIRFNSKIKIKNKIPFLSICIPIYNTEKYIKRAVLSVINQSFQDFELLIINDFSNDNTGKIIKRLSIIDNRIKYINHIKNFGVHYSRVEAVLNSKGKYILFLDPDDMLLNGNLFKELFKYNLYNNFDIIEFIVYHQKEGTNEIYYPNEHSLNHNHNYTFNIIYQPELKNIIYYKPRTKNYSQIICRTVWNKIYKRRLLIKTIKYISNINNQKLIVADDTMINLTYH